MQILCKTFGMYVHRLYIMHRNKITINRVVYRLVLIKHTRTHTHLQVPVTVVTFLALVDVVVIESTLSQEGIHTIFARRLLTQRAVERRAEEATVMTVSTAINL